MFEKIMSKPGFGGSGAFKGCWFSSSAAKARRSASSKLLSSCIRKFWTICSIIQTYIYICVYMYMYSLYEACNMYWRICTTICSKRGAGNLQGLTEQRGAAETAPAIWDLTCSQGFLTISGIFLDQGLLGCSGFSSKTCLPHHRRRKRPRTPPKSAQEAVI